MRVPQLLDIPRLIMCSECIRHYGYKTTQCRNYHHHALLRRLLKASSKHRMNRALPRQAANARRTNYSIYMQSTAPCNKINDALAHERPRPVRGFTTAVKKRPSASELSRPALSKQRLRTQHLSRATATTDAGQKERKRNGNRKQCRAPLSIIRPLCPLDMPSFDSCCDPMLQDHSIIDAM